MVFANRLLFARRASNLGFQCPYLITEQQLDFRFLRARCAGVSQSAAPPVACLALRWCVRAGHGTGPRKCRPYVFAVSSLAPLLRGPAWCVVEEDGRQAAGLRLPC